MKMSPLGQLIMVFCAIIALLTFLPSIQAGNIANNVVAATNFLNSFGYWVLGGGSAIPGNIIPASDNTYDLGSSSAGWRNAWVSNNLTVTNNATVGGTLYAKTGRAATYTVASYTANTTLKAQADYVCDADGDDGPEFRTVAAAATDWSTVKLLGGNFTMLSSVNLTKRGLIWDATDAYITYNGTSYAFGLIGTGGDATWNSQLRLGRLLAVGVATSSATAKGVYIKGWNYGTVSGEIEWFQSGAGIQIESTLAGAVWTGLLDFPKLFCRSCNIGVEYIGDGNTHDLVFGQYWWSTEATNGYGMKDGKTSPYVTNIHINVAWLEPSSYDNCIGFYFQGVSIKIDKLIWDNTTPNGVSIQSIQHVDIGMFDRTHGGARAALDAQIPWSSFEPAIINTYGGRVTEYSTGAGWTATVVNGGAGGLNAGMLDLNTSATINSSSLRYTNTMGLNKSGTWNDINWDKRLFISFIIGRYNSDTQSITRVQLKNAATLGQAATNAIGLEVLNLDMYGESCNVTTRGTVALSANLTSTSLQKEVCIFLDPDVHQVKWYVDGNLKATQSTATNTPSGLGAAQAFIVCSIQNGATGGVDAATYIGRIRVWQADY